jgi:ABC-type multidrug transport system fused ATPase/permease subunit
MASTFTMYILLDNEMKPENVFTLVSTFMVVQSSLRALPVVISALIQAFIAIKRIECFLAETEIHELIISEANQEISSKPRKDGAGATVDEVRVGIEYENENGKKEEKVKWDVEVKGNFFWDLEMKKIGEKSKGKLKKKKPQNDLEVGLLEEEEKMREPRLYKAIDNINLKVKKGDFTAIIGEYNLYFFQ